MCVRRTSKRNNILCNAFFRDAGIAQSSFGCDRFLMEYSFCAFGMFLWQSIAPQMSKY